MKGSVLLAGSHIRRYTGSQLQVLIMGCIVLLCALLVYSVSSYPIVENMRQSVQLFVAETNVVVAAEFGKVIFDHLVRWVGEILTIYFPRLA